MNSVVAEFLSLLEQREARLLVWGAVDGSFLWEEIEEAAETFLQSNCIKDFEDGYNLAKELLRKHLLFEFTDNGEQRFRTRMAETVRLMARLRQLFPSDMSERRWMTAPTLVADYRFIARPRVYPVRLIEPARVEEEVKSTVEITKVQKEVLQCLLTKPDGAMIKLARFQLAATRRILSQVMEWRASGTIVSAGTGSGKTAAFYLPAYVHLAEGLNESRWTRCLALYPRKELLKDQLLDAFRQARHIDETLRRNKKRKLVLGALFGATPYTCNSRLGEEWKATRGGHVCPLMPCPKCGGELLWMEADRSQRVERIQCASKGCGCTIGPDELVLTRESMKAHPPDILFTTTEMLNQRMGDSEISHLFGLHSDRKRRPELVLLDEVHTYSGVTGAQVALLLRRWRHASGSHPHFVGLSATLANATSFFAELTGLRNNEVEEVDATRSGGDADPPVREGMEYMLVLRGDPVSGAPLLATTIQAAMLLRRVLEPRTYSAASNIFGRKVFIFTDALDVTNRLYYYMLSAEGMDGWGKPDPSQPGGPLGSLANLRASNFPDQRVRLDGGQWWQLCEDIGHRLTRDNYLHVGRTSSQDTGVTADAELIVATASLEVGFNDPDVGAVLQHKAPRDAAQFLQRKGRAGRDRAMRPWTVVVLSDFGRDRHSYQAYDLLFDPEVPPRDLPIQNSYVLRMQATYAFFDWMAFQLNKVAPGNVWEDFAKPISRIYVGVQENVRRRQERAAQIIQNVLDADETREDLSVYLGSALMIDRNRVEQFLWDPPRALLTAVLPTLLRRLRSQWTRENKQGGDTQGRHPLPEFVTATLFSDLNLPEVIIKTPPQQRGDEPREDPLPVLQAMREFAPGRISRRYGILNAHARHWIAPPYLEDTGEAQELSLSSSWIEYEELGRFQIADSEGVRDLRCVRPFRLKPIKPDLKSVQDFSNALLVWHSQICRRDEGYLADLPQPFRWTAIVKELRFFSHSQNSSVEVRRFATASEARIGLQHGGSFEATIRFVSEETSAEPVGIGFILDVDALLIRCHLPSQFNLCSPEGDDRQLRGLRAEYFRDRVLQCPELSKVANVFQREWLAQIYLASLCWQSIKSDISLEQVCDAAQSDPVFLSSSEVLDVIFQTLWIESEEDTTVVDGGEQPPDEPRPAQQRRHQEILTLLQSPEVLQWLHRHAPILWSLPDESWSDWLRHRFKATLAAAVFDALQQLCPDMDSGDLVVDLSSGPQAPGTLLPPRDLEEIWITEGTVGGGGVIEKALERYNEDPRRFFELVEGALEPSEFEVADQQLTLLLRWASDDLPVTAEVREKLRSLRAARTHDASACAFLDLKALLHRRGMLISHTVLAAINARIVRPNSSSKTDKRLYSLVNRWEALEQTLGVEIDARVFAFVASEDEDLESTLNMVGDVEPRNLQQWRFNTIYGLLWPRGSLSRRIGLAISNPFTSPTVPDRNLVRGCLEPLPTPISIDSAEWKERALERLAANGLVILRSSAESASRMRQLLILFLAEPVEAGFLLFYPKVRQIRREAGMVDVMLELTGAVQ